RRIINVPHRGIGNATLKKLIAASAEQKSDLIKTLEVSDHYLEKPHAGIKEFVQQLARWRSLFHSKPLDQAIQGLVDELNFIEWVESQYSGTKQAVRKRNEISQFILAAGRFLK